MNLLTAYQALPTEARQTLENVAANILPHILGAAWRSLQGNRSAAAFAGIYQQWRSELIESEASVASLDAAFREFFCRKPTVDELEKLLQNRPRDVDVAILQQQLRESFAWANCPLPAGSLHEQLYAWVRDLQTLLEDTPEYRGKFQIPLQNAIRELGRSEALLANDSDALARYKASLVRKHRNIRFAGMAVIDDRDEVSRDRVFVMPRIVADAQADARRKSEPKPQRAYQLLTAKRAPRFAVILGGPGSGKTTLLESLCLALAQGPGGGFPWARSLPPLLPILYCVGDLDLDIERHGGIWDCLRHHGSRETGRPLPVDFFPRQMDRGGLMLLFDGLDEATSPARRDRIVELIEAFASNLSPESRVLITSRPHDYRRRFEAASFRHYALCEFDDEEIQTFIQGWQSLHQPDPGLAAESRERLWNALKARPDILPLARNALLLTMIVRVHFGLRQLPDSRLELYEKCSETLLKYWNQAKPGLPQITFDPNDKRRFLAQLAYEMQCEFGEQLSEEGPLRIRKDDLANRLRAFLRAEGSSTVNQVDAIIDRLHARDAILVQYGGDQFGFVHRSFQEYFAAVRLASGEVEKEEFKAKFELSGWNETLYLAVAQLRPPDRRRALLDLLRRGRPEFALACLQAAPSEEPWLRSLVRFLSRYTWGGQKHLALSPAECADACEGRSETLALLEAMLAREAREGQSIAAAVELAEELARRGHARARSLLDSFFAESARYGLDSTAGTVPIDGFHLDIYPVTNRHYECMVPGHVKLRDEYSNTDDQPVIYVSWYEARLFSRWRGQAFRLPTEQEWEHAASFDPATGTKRQYPWGEEFDPAKCNTREAGLGKTTPVGAYAAGVSAYGCYDMAGNVWEWTSSPWSEGSETPVIRGGSWFVNRGFAACAFRFISGPHDRVSHTGFRCAGT